VRTAIYEGVDIGKEEKVLQPYRGTLVCGPSRQPSRLDCYGIYKSVVGVLVVRSIAEKKLYTLERLVPPPSLHCL
jgi:hypothetical protein